MPAKPYWNDNKDKYYIRVFKSITSYRVHKVKHYTKYNIIETLISMKAIAHISGLALLNKYEKKQNMNQNILYCKKGRKGVKISH